MQQRIRPRHAHHAQTDARKALHREPVAACLASAVRADERVEAVAVEEGQTRAVELDVAAGAVQPLQQGGDGSEIQLAVDRDDRRSGACRDDKGHLCQDQTSWSCNWKVPGLVPEPALPCTPRTTTPQP